MANALQYKARSEFRYIQAFTIKVGGGGGGLVIIFGRSGGGVRAKVAFVGRGSTT